MSDTDDALRGQIIAHEMAIKYLLATLLKHQIMPPLEPLNDFIQPFIGHLSTMDNPIEHQAYLDAAQSITKDLGESAWPRKSHS